MAAWRETADHLQRANRPIVRTRIRPNDRSTGGVQSSHDFDLTLAMSLQVLLEVKLVEWLDGFDGAEGGLRAVILSHEGAAGRTEPAHLRERGAPDGGKRFRKPFTTDFAEWTQVPAGRYLAAFPELRCASESHAVYRVPFGRWEFLVPALVLMRGLFPLIADGFAYAFTPRPLEALCILQSRAGHWTVCMPDFTGVYKGRFRRAQVEALTWASLFPSARNTWYSVLRAAVQGRMALDLPNAVARVLPTGVRIGKTIHVTTLSVNAILATEAPSAFAGQAPTSFLFDQHTDPIAPAVNAYYERHEGDAAKEYRLSDSEWSAVSHFCERPWLNGRKPRDNAREVADGLVIRAATLLPWAQIPVGIAGSALALHSKNWRMDGRLHQLLSCLRRTRGDLPYLRECAADAIARKHSRKRGT